MGPHQGQAQAPRCQLTAPLACPHPPSPQVRSMVSAVGEEIGKRRGKAMGRRARGLFPRGCNHPQTLRSTPPLCLVRSIRSSRPAQHHSPHPPHCVHSSLPLPFPPTSFLPTLPSLLPPVHTVYSTHLTQPDPHTGSHHPRTHQNPIRATLLIPLQPNSPPDTSVQHNHCGSMN